MGTTNVYFELTRAFNAEGKIAILGSGQAVVHYRLAIMSKDGDWILREDPRACATILRILAQRGARYRPGGLPEGHQRLVAQADELLPRSPEEPR